MKNGMIRLKKLKTETDPETTAFKTVLATIKNKVVYDRLTV